MNNAATAAFAEVAALLVATVTVLNDGGNRRVIIDSENGKMAEVPNALADCLRQSMQWQWKSAMGFSVGVVNLTSPQAHEPFMMDGE